VCAVVSVHDGPINTWINTEGLLWKKMASGRPARDAWWDADEEDSPPAQSNISPASQLNNNANSGTNNSTMSVQAQNTGSYNSGTV
jgi:hypothetical protein